MHDPPVDFDPALRDAPDLGVLLSERNFEPALGLTNPSAQSRRVSVSLVGEVAPVWTFVWKQARDPMVVILLVAALIALALGERIDALAILVIVGLNACFGAVQEFRADRALAALAAIEPSRARVRRDGRLQEIDASDVVVGDIVLVEAGDRLPADLRWWDTVGLSTDESLLSGESLPVEKRAAAAASTNGLTVDRVELGFAGSLAVRGRGEGVAYAVGEKTETGRVRGLLRAGAAGETPLRQQLRRLGRRLSWFVVGLAISLFGLGVLRGEEPSTMLLVALSLAVAALPEALPAVVTAALALGSRRMAGRNALVRRLEAAEALGSVSVIASDKTGTLTTNRMDLRRLWPAESADEGWIDADPATARQAFPDLVRALAANHDCRRAEGHWVGDPTEVALAEFAAGAGVAEGDVPERISEVPFDSSRQRMTTVHAEGADGAWIVMKGSAEAVLSSCTLEPEHRERLLEAAAQGAASGHRVLGLAQRRVARSTLPSADDSRWVSIVEKDLHFLGFVGLMDPPRAGAREAVAACHRAGIRILMITGDHPETARAVAEELGLTSEGRRVVVGRELDEIGEGDLGPLLESADVVARVAPEHKVRVLEWLQQQGHMVAMTGDGVNDAPALKRANVGVAMGLRGTDVARQAADLVLLDDDFSTIVDAVEEGRRIFANIQRFVRYTLTSNLGEITLMVMAPLVGLPLPLLPVQILWINLVTDGLPGLALGVEPVSANALRQTPRDPREPVLDRGVLRHIVLLGSVIGALCLLVQVTGLRLGFDRWQTMVFCTLVFAQLAQAWGLRVRDVERSLRSLALLAFAIGSAVALQLAAVYLPWLQTVFRTEALSVTELLVVIGLSFTVLPMTLLARSNDRTRGST